MATIVGAVASSHTPTIGFALDTHKQSDPVWAPIFAGYKPVQEWLAAKRPDVLLIVFNDHVTSFFFDHYSHFALGIGESYAVADEGGGPRALPPVRGHAALSHHIAAGLVADDFDLAYFQDKPLDHGCFSPLSMLWPHEPAWPGAIVPLQIGVLEFPIPSAMRCYRLGQSLRKAIESYPEDLKVVLVATGGLSHQVHGERCGFNNTEWDLQFLDLIEHNPERLADMTHAEGEVRVVIEEERGDVIVRDEEQHVGLLVEQPLLHGLVALEDRGPDRILLLVGVEGEADGGGVGRCDAPDDAGHGDLRMNVPSRLAAG